MTLASWQTCAAQSGELENLQDDVHGSDVHVSPVMGWNFSLDSTGQHNSATGWAEIITPDVSFRFNRHFSLSSSVPWYASVNAFVSVKAKGVTTYPLQSGKNLLGDANVAGHFEASHKDLSDLLIATVGFNTGNYRFGLSSNTTTYNVTNHLEYQAGVFTPDIEFGEGDSTTLANQNVRRIYSAVGPLANFQAGTWIDLPHNLGLDIEAFEELPIGNQNVYGTVTRKGKKGKTTTKQVLEGTGAAEDNGVTAEFDVPIGKHLRLVGSYDRSFVQGLDTASAGMTWTMRAPKLVRDHD